MFQSRGLARLAGAHSLWGARGLIPSMAQKLPEQQGPP